MRCSIFGGTLTLDRIDVGNLIGGRLVVFSDVSLVGAFGGNGGRGRGAMVSPLPADLMNDNGARGGNACPLSSDFVGFVDSGGSFLAINPAASVAVAAIADFNSAALFVSSLITGDSECGMMAFETLTE